MGISMFALDMTFTVEILAAIGAGFLLMSALTREGPARRAGQWVSGIALALTVSVMLCTGYYGLAYWSEGLYSPKNNATTMMMPGHEHMQGMMEHMGPCQQQGGVLGDCMNETAPGATKPTH